MVFAVASIVALAALAVAWWGMQRPSVEQASVSKLAAKVPPPGPQSLASVSPASAGPTLAPVAPTPALGTMRDALKDATPALKRCSQQAHGLLFVNFTTIENGETFAVSVPGSASEAVDRCVRAATANLRFQPHPAETFTTKEYTP